MGMSTLLFSTSSTVVVSAAATVAALTEHTSGSTRSPKQPALVSAMKPQIHTLHAPPSPKRAFAHTLTPHASPPTWLAHVEALTRRVAHALASVTTQMSLSLSMVPSQARTP